MKTIIHISDNHSVLIPLPEGDIVLSSGDFLPNASRGKVNIEVGFQSRWVELEAERIKTWLGGRPFLFCGGNHDFIDPCPILQQHGINAINITNQVVEHQGIVFYGFPYIPFIAGEWNYEKLLPDMNVELKKMLDTIQDSKKTVDVLVTHAPPYGICDFYMGSHLGNTLLTNLLSYEQLSPLPAYLCCGHIHQAQGFANIFGVEVSQAATVVHQLGFREKTSL